MRQAPLAALVLAFLVGLAAPAYARDATAGCVTVKLDAGRDVLGRTVVIYADGTKDHFDIAGPRYAVNNASTHGPIIRVAFSNGQSTELAAPVGCTPSNALPRTGFVTVLLFWGVAILFVGVCALGASRARE